jgi:mRNA interferase MazF
MTNSGTAIYKPGELLLVPFPFTDQTQYKVRPVVVISNETYNRMTADVIGCGVTSNLTPTRFSLQITQASLAKGILKANSKIKVDAITALEKGLVIKKFGRLNKATIEKIKNHIRVLFEV